MAKYDKQGREIPDNTPVEMPLNFQHGDPLAADIRRMIQREMSMYAEAAGRESFEEANDFDVGEEEELKSPYELDEGFSDEEILERAGQDMEKEREREENKEQRDDRGGSEARVKEDSEESESGDSIPGGGGKGPRSGALGGSGAREGKRKRRG